MEATTRTLLQSPEKSRWSHQQFFKFYAEFAKQHDEIVRSDLTTCGIAPDLRSTVDWDRGVRMIAKMSDDALNTVVASDGTTALYCAVHNRHVESVRALLLRLPAINIPSNIVTAITTPAQNNPLLSDEVCHLVLAGWDWLDHYFVALYESLSESDSPLHFFSKPIVALLWSYLVPDMPTHPYKVLQHTRALALHLP
jgi:hypothetical protein